MSSFSSAASSVSRTSQLIPNYIFYNGSLNDGLGNDLSDNSGFSKDCNNIQLEDLKRYTPIHATTGAPIYNSISTGSDEHKQRLRMSNQITKAKTNQIEGKAPKTTMKDNYLHKTCELQKSVGELYKVSTPKKREILLIPKNEKMLNSISRNIINTQQKDNIIEKDNRSEELKSMFSIKSLEKKEDNNRIKQSALINEFKKVNNSKNKFLIEKESAITCINNTCSNIKVAFNAIEITGKVFIDVLMHLVNAFDLDHKEVYNANDKFGKKFMSLPHFPVSSIDIPPDTVILQCFDCGLIYYTGLPLNKQQLGTVGILDPKPVNFGLLDSNEMLDEIRNRNSPYYCWGNLEPRDLSPNQIEFIRRTDLRKQKKFSAQDLVDIYYYRYRRDRRYDEDFPTFVLSDPQLHLYKFYRETMHGAYNGNKTPLPEIGNHYLPSPWNKDRKYKSSSSSMSSTSNDRFEKDENGFTILPVLKFNETQNIDDYIYKPDNTHVFPFILDSL